MNKKGTSSYTIIALILFVAGAILVFANFNEIKTLLESVTEKTPCEVAIDITHAKTNIPGWTAKLGDLKKFCSIEERKMNLIFEKESVNEINTKIARALFDCITLTKYGKVDMAESHTQSDRNVCFTCATFSFIGEAKEDYLKSNTEYLSEGGSFSKWCKDNKLNKDQTYEQFFKQFSPENIKSTDYKIILQSTPIINPNEESKLYVFKTIVGSSSIFKEDPEAILSLIRKGDKTACEVWVNE